MITARAGCDATVVAVGTMVSRALTAATELAAEGIDVRVLDAAWIAPFDRDAVIAAATETAGIVTAEEAVVSGGLGAAVTGIVSGLGADVAAADRQPRDRRRVRSNRRHGVPARAFRSDGQRDRRRRPAGPRPWLIVPRGLVVGVDQGTSSTKAVLVDAAGTVLRRASVPVDVSYPQPGWVEQDAEQLEASVFTAIAEIVDGLDDARDGAVVALGVSAQRESAIVWERASGKALGPVLGWQDRRTQDVAARLTAEGVAGEVRSITGLPLDPMFSALKFGWLLDAIDPDRRRSRNGEIAVGTVDAWILAALTGHHRVEAGNASRTQLLDLASVRWSERLCELFGVPTAALPEVVASDAPVHDRCGAARRRAGGRRAGRLARRHLRPRHPHAWSHQGHVRNGQLDHGAVRRRQWLDATRASSRRSLGGSARRRTHSRATSSPPEQPSGGWPSCSAALRANSTSSRRPSPHRPT